MTEKACTECQALTKKERCPVCNSTSLSDEWSGLVIILDVEESKIADEIGAEEPGRYAIKVR